MRLPSSLCLVGGALAIGCGGDPAAPPVDAPVVELAAVTASDIFVAVGTDMAVADGALVIGADRAIAARSTDGTSWEWIDTGHPGALLDVAHGGGLYVAVGMRMGATATGIVLRSPDGIQWEEVELEGTTAWSSVAYGNGRFLAAGMEASGVSLVASSVDGRDWEIVAETDLLSARVVFALEAFHIFGEGSVLFTSADGAEWTTRVVPEVTRLSGLTAAHGVLLASGVHDCCFGEIPDRIEYYTVRSDAAGALHAIDSDLRAVRMAHAAVPGGVLALTVGALHHSADAETWSVAYDAEPGAYLLDLVHANGRTVAVGRRNIVISEDGESWSTVPVPPQVVLR